MAEQRWQFDDSAQKRVRDLVIGPGLYGRYSVEGRYVYVDRGRIATLLQKRFAIDTICQGREGAAVCIEEKIRRWTGIEYKDILLETQSCSVPGHESEGWLFYGKADFLNYVQCQEDGNVMCHLTPFPEVQKLVLPRLDRFPEYATRQHNRTVFRVVPFEFIRKNVGIFSVPIFPTPEGRAAVIAYNGTHYRQGRIAKQGELFSGGPDAASRP